MIQYSELVNLPSLGSFNLRQCMVLRTGKWLDPRKITRENKMTDEVKNGCQLCPLNKIFTTNAAILSTIQQSEFKARGGNLRSDTFYCREGEKKVG